MQSGRFRGARHRLVGGDGSDGGVFDVVVCGAGPAGSTCAYYIAQYGKGVYSGTALRIGLLEKGPMGRDKYCGDAWCAPALSILEDMMFGPENRESVLCRLEQEGLVCNCLCGGFVSPAGHSFIVNDRETKEEDKNMSTRCYAIKRKICDERIARCAASQDGVTLVEHAHVLDTNFDKTSGVWTVICKDGRVFKSRMLVAADGATSTIARSLGIVKTSPQGVAARRYIKPGTHNFKADGVLLYPDYTLPGYAALFRHYDDSIDLGLYLLPNGAAKDSDLECIYSNKLMTDPFVSRALGPNVEFEERLKVGSLRLGGVEKSYGDHILLVGDAAGQVDPLTGEGIHTGMIGGKLAAQTIAEMFRKGNFSSDAGKLYHNAWWSEFGSDFPISAVAGSVVYRLPFLMDAVPKASQAKGAKAGSDFFATFGAVMTGALPKQTFLRPSVAIPLMIETGKQFLSQFVFRNERSYYSDPRSTLANELKRWTSWDTQCLLEPTVDASGLAPGCTSSEYKDVFRYADDRRPPVLVLYGTEYGFSRSIALQLCEMISRCGNASPRCLSLEYAASEKDIVNWRNEQAVYMVCSTAGDGEPPVHAKPFFEQAQQASLGNLSHIHFAVLACGDSNYPKFCKAGQDLSDLFTSAGAKQIMEMVMVDAESEEGVQEWVNTCAEFKLDLPSFKVKGQEDYLREKIRENIALFTPRNISTRMSPINAVVRTKRLLTSCTDNKNDAKEVWHIEFDISNQLDTNFMRYQPGDSIGVQATNDDDLVNEILDILCLPGNTPYPGFGSIKEYLLGRDLKNSLRDEKEDPEKEHVIDVLSRAQPQHAKTMLGRLKPLLARYYSIASSPTNDRGEIHVCVAAVRYNTLSVERKGVASTYLIDRAKVGTTVRIWVQENPEFKPPRQNDQPIIMIGPGTGIAPFRSFIRENPNLRDSVLFFGCRRGSMDFLYKDELIAWAGQNGNTLVTAFSREQNKKVYVQDRMEEKLNSERIAHLITIKKAHVYICGEGFHMANDVRDTLRKILITQAKSSKECVVRILQEQLHLDVWVA